MKYIYVLLIGFLCLPGFQSNAQILPPDFLCVKSDTLFWNPANNPCGPFEYYEIYFSPDKEGPYVLLARITDPNQHFYSNPSNQEYFYYLQTIHDCPGETPLQSDTLNNLPPALGPIQSVTVNGDFVDISWEPSASPETEGYIIYRITNLGTIPIDTVFNATTYTDTGADPQNGSEEYFVVALDACGNISLFGQSHKTIFIDATVDSCNQSIDLSWEPYDNWDNGVGENIIYVGLNGANPVPVDTIQGLVGNYSYTGIDKGNDYCIFIISKEAGTGNQSGSNTLCVTPNIVQPVRELYLENISYLGNNQIEVSYGWSNNAELVNAYLSVLKLNDDVIQLQPINFTTPLQTSNSVIFSDPNISNEKHWTFGIETVDNCGDSKNSETGVGIILTASSGGTFLNHLTWTPLDIENLEVIEYTIETLYNGIYTTIGSVNGNILEFDDNLDPSDPAYFNKCYRIIARSRLTLPDGTTKIIEPSYSTIDCVAQNYNYFMPNAFAPRGRNQSFAPIFSYATPTVYSFKIFNRYGGILFNSTDPELRWNGKKDGRDVPQGVYQYVLEFEQPDGEQVSTTGWVMLVR
jgi:gliding motility-associated-like protein